MSTTPKQNGFTPPRPMPPAPRPSPWPMEEYPSADGGPTKCYRCGRPFVETWEQFACRCNASAYALADAMLKARQR